MQNIQGMNVSYQGAQPNINQTNVMNKRNAKPQDLNQSKSAGMLPVINNK
jgi:hypothetical protein